MRAAYEMLLGCAAVCLLEAGVWAASPPVTTDPVSQSADGVPNVLRVVERFTAPEVKATPAGAMVRMDGCDQDVVPGAPALPIRGVRIPVPVGWRAARVRLIPGASTRIELKQPLTCASEAVPLSAGARPWKPTPRDARIYRRSQPYPDYGAGEARRQRLDRHHGVDQIILTLHPAQYLPASNMLLCHSELTVEVVWERAKPAAGREWRPRRSLTADAHGELPSSLSAVAAADGGMVALDGATPLPADDYAHVIIAPSRFIADTPPPWNLTALSVARREAGITSTNVPVEWIDANYSGRDQAERIRAFVRDAYDNWNTRFVLLVGSVTNVAARNLYCGFSYYTAQIPADALYYGCLDGDFDRDGDSIFGEIGDGIDGRDVDLLAEVQVGRFPVENTNEVSRMVRKTLAYEATPAALLSPVVHAGEYLGFGGVAEYATGAMEQIRLGATDGGFSALGFENPAFADDFDTSDNFYDAPDYRWPSSGILARFNQNRHVFNHLGHGSPQYCFKLNLGPSYTGNRQAIAGLTNSVYFLAYSQACDAGSFDTVADCFAEQLATSSGGAFAVVMNTRSGWGYRDNLDGPSQRFHRKFWDIIFRGADYHLGAVNMRAKEELSYLVNPYGGDVFRWCYYELTLFGDPHPAGRRPRDGPFSGKRHARAAPDHRKP
ncbi:MAG: C25 family cysteine peptidase [Kiritimatiellae bacterium]|nr:C25 family cysteine peptidase [Kiritimatiellia bacterium]